MSDPRERELGKELELSVTIHDLEAIIAAKDAEIAARDEAILNLQRDIQCLQEGPTTEEWMGMLEKGRAEIAAYREALQDLYDEQNGPPLIKWEQAWNAAMKQAEAVLANPAPIADAMLRVIAAGEEVDGYLTGPQPDWTEDPDSCEWEMRRDEAFQKHHQALSDLRAARSDTSAGGGE